MEVFCILGNQLFELKHFGVEEGSKIQVFMREDRELCTHYRYHKHKLIFFLSAMRKYANELREAGVRVHYETLGESEEPFEQRLLAFLAKTGCTTLNMFEIEDKFFESRILEILRRQKIELNLISSPMFLTPRERFVSLLGNSQKPFMKTFYQAQRKRLKILLEADQKPTGGKWSFDEDNRKPLPRDHVCPPLPEHKMDKIELEVASLVDREFADHPGESHGFWLPTDRKSARRWARDFFDQRFELFGPYEDALPRESAFVYHSVLTPFLNTGLVTPRECVAVALKTRRERNIPLNSAEGYIRQVIGWREFIRGIYQNFSELQENTNHFQHKRKLAPVWYSAETGIAPLDDVLRKVLKYGYAHHIERLMVVGSLMLLLEIDPHEAHRWFMEMFVDSSDWVMGPNVYGMALFSDGGIFATKPYICGSNYYRKMSGYKSGSWCEGVDGLYWTFVHKHRDEFARNPRMSMMTRALAKISPERLQHLEAEANQLRERLTSS